jgi:hypothetical protein
MILNFRAFAYFCIRYFLKLGFLDGLAGFRSVSQARLSPRFARPSKLVFRRLRHFWQGLWYRWMVDIEIGRMKHMAVK